MSLGKTDITKNISSKAQISSISGKKLLDKFIEIVVSKSQKGPVKIPNFGTFYTHISPKRIGRNPKTKKEFLISKRFKLALKTSNNIKNFIN
tara:strand:+ start:1907 stop:2182 length:276 start_codon:yes stop_codon:yes gene_type:complete